MRTKSFVKMPAMILEDDRAIDAGDQAMMLWWSMWCRSLMMNNDGKWRGVQIARLNVDGWGDHLAKLIEHRLVVLTDEGYVLIDWLDYNESVTERAKRLAADAERQKRARAERAKKPASELKAAS